MTNESINKKRICSLNSWRDNHRGKAEEKGLHWMWPSPEDSTTKTGGRGQRQLGWCNQCGPRQTNHHCNQVYARSRLSQSPLSPGGGAAFISVWASSSRRVVHQNQVHVNGLVKLSLTNIQAQAGPSQPSPPPEGRKGIGRERRTFPMLGCERVSTISAGDQILLCKLINNIFFLREILTK